MQKNITATVVLEKQMRMGIMSFDDFLEELRKWLQSINNSKDVNDVILDGKYFSYDEGTKKYSINEENIEQLKDIDYVFVGDNPGTNEKDHRAFFYVEFADGWIEQNKSTAGYKFYKFKERLSEFDKKRILTFNKCLLHTSKTNKLSKKQINGTSYFVVNFLRILKEYNQNIKLIFMGLSRKFKSIYGSIYDSNKDIIIIPHPCSSLYTYKGDEIIKKGNIDLDNFYESWNNKNILKRFIDQKLSQAPLDDCTISNNDDGDNGDEGDASSPCVVR